MKIKPTTTLGELELQLRSHGLCCFVKPEADGRYYALVGDADEHHTVNGNAYGSTIDEAIDGALMEFQQTKYGPKPTVRS